MALDVNFLESMTKLKAHPLNCIFQSFFSYVKQTKFNIFTGKLHWLPLGELVNVLPRQMQAAYLGFPVRTPAEST